MSEVSSTIKSKSMGYLLLPNLPHQLPVHVFDNNVLDTSLISISELCHVGCTATFTDTACHINYLNKPVLTAHKCPTDSLWHTTIPRQIQPTIPSANTALLLASDKNFVLFAHAALGSPALSVCVPSVHAHTLLLPIKVSGKTR